MCERPQTPSELWDSCRTEAGLQFVLMMETLKCWAVLCLRMSLLSPLWPHLTAAAMFLFVHLVCLLIQLPRGHDYSVSVPQTPSLFTTPRPSIPGTADLMKSSVTTSDLSAIVFPHVIWWVLNLEGFKNLHSLFWGLSVCLCPSSTGGTQRSFKS